MFKKQLIHRVDIHRRISSGTNDLGEPIVTEELQWSDVPCRMVPQTLDFKMFSAGEKHTKIYKAYFEPEVVIQVDDRIVWNGDTFVVKDSHIEWTRKPHHRSCMLEVV